MGACDYILKTTPPAVLLARLRLHLRQNEYSTQSKGIQSATITPHTTLRFGTLTIDPTNRSVLLGGEQVSFPPLILNYCGSWQPMPGRLWTAMRC